MTGVESTWQMRMLNLCMRYRQTVGMKLQTKLLMMKKTTAVAYPGVPVIFAELPSFLQQEVVLVGKYFLENYITILDYPKRKVMFTEVYNSNYTLSYSAGIMISKKEDKFDITGIWKNSPAAEFGITPDTELQAINGKSHDEISQKEIMEMLMNKKVAKFYLTILRDELEEEMLLRKRDLFE